MDNSVQRIMGFQLREEREVVYYGTYEKGLVRFDLMDRESKKRVAIVQISPYGMVNLYMNESRSPKQVQYIMNQLREIILDDSKATVELKPTKVLYRRSNMYPIVLRNFIVELDLPISVKPMSWEIKMSTLKIGPENLTN